LLASETAEWEAVDAHIQPLPVAAATIPAANPAASTGYEQLDDVTVREDESEEALGDENESEPIALDDLQITKAETASTSTQLPELAAPDLRLQPFARDSAALKNRHIGPLLNLARRITASGGDRRAVTRVRIAGISSPTEARSRVVAKERSRAVAAALREA